MSFVKYIDSLHEYRKRKIIRPPWKFDGNITYFVCQSCNELFLSVIAANKANQPEASKIIIYFRWRVIFIMPIMKSLYASKINLFGDNNVIIIKAIVNLLILINI